MNTAYPLFSRQASLILPAGVVTIKPVSKPNKYEMYQAQTCSISESAPESYKSMMTKAF
jgi:hypothetical protein